MADNVTANAGAGGATFAADDIAGVHFPRTKIAIGADGANDGDVSSANPLPVTQTGVATSAKQDTVIGHLDGVEGLLTTIDGDTSTLAVVGGGLEATALRVTIASDSTGVLSVDDNGASLTVDNAGLTALNGAISGTEVQVDVLTLPNVTLAAGTNTNEVVGDAAHDAAVAGNPVLISGAAQDMDDTAPPNRVSAESDVTRFATDRDGGLFVHPHGPQVWSFHSDGSSALTDSTVHAAPGAGLSLYVTDIVVSTGAATALNVFFEEGASKVLGPYYLEAVAGRGLALHFQTPKKITANTALTVTTSAAIAQCVDVTGFTAQG